MVGGGGGAGGVGTDGGFLFEGRVARMTVLELVHAFMDPATSKCAVSSRIYSELVYSRVNYRHTSLARSSVSASCFKSEPDNQSRSWQWCTPQWDPATSKCTTHNVMQFPGSGQQQTSRSMYQTSSKHSI